MALDLGKLDADPPLPEGFTVQQVNDDESLQQWGQVCAQGFGMPAFVGEGLSDFMRYVDQETIRAYLGRLDSVPVATSLLVLAPGVAGMYNITTLPEARQKGIGARMTDLPLLEARARGYRAAILHASVMGESVYRSLGFEKYCKIDQYIWSPKAAQTG
jgi:ribosomal protein S18 acetylase RimI-like enzyme